MDGASAPVHRRIQILMMKRKLAVTVGVVAMLVVVAACPVGAFPRASERVAEQASTTVPGDAIGLSLSQVASSGLAINLDAGQSQEHKLLISNFTARPAVVGAVVGDATRRGVLGAGPAGVGRVRRRSRAAGTARGDEHPDDGRSAERDAARSGARTHRRRRSRPWSRRPTARPVRGPRCLAAGLARRQGRRDRADRDRRREPRRP